MAIGFPPVRNVFPSVRNAVARFAMHFRFHGSLCDGSWPLLIRSHGCWSTSGSLYVPGTAEVQRVPAATTHATSEDRRNLTLPSPPSTRRSMTPAPLTATLPQFSRSEEH